MNRSSWNLHYGCYNPPQGTERFGTTMIRPDLVQYPVLLIAILAHEGTHAIDPAITQEHTATIALNQIPHHDPAFLPKFLEVASLHYGNDIRANEKVLDVIRVIRPNDGLLPEQTSYFEQQRESVMAARARVIAVDTTRRALVDLASDLLSFVRSSSAASDNPSRTQLDIQLEIIIEQSQAQTILTPAWSELTNESLTKLTVLLKAPHIRSLRQNNDTPLDRVLEKVTDLITLLPHSAQVLRDNQRAKDLLILPPKKVL